MRSGAEHRARATPKPVVTSGPQRRRGLRAAPVRRRGTRGCPCRTRRGDSYRCGRDLNTSGSVHADSSQLAEPNITHNVAPLGTITPPGIVSSRQMRKHGLVRAGVAQRLLDHRRNQRRIVVQRGHQVRLFGERSPEVAPQARFCLAAGDLDLADDRQHLRGVQRSAAAAVFVGRELGLEEIGEESSRGVFSTSLEL